MSTNALGTFLSKFQDWKYCPPSNHLWTVTFLLAPRNGSSVENASFSTLFNNIINVNNRYNKMYSPLWNVKTPNDDDGTFVVSAQDSNIGFFLATDVRTNSNSINIADGSSNASVSYTGWLSFGKTQTGRNHNHEVKIKFYKTNWDINEIFFDRWIAAIGQQGLIEDSSLLNIKANIIIREYAAGAPGVKSDIWIPRKQITLLRAFPKNRAQIEYSYSPEKAGEMETDTIEFVYDAYQIQYFKIPSFTPGYITSSTAEGTSQVGETLTAKDIENRYSNNK